MLVRRKMTGEVVFERVDFEVSFLTIIDASLNVTLHDPAEIIDVVLQTSDSFI